MGADAVATMTLIRYERPDGKFVEVIYERANTADFNVHEARTKVSRNTAALFLGPGPVTTYYTPSEVVPVDLGEVQTWAKFKAMTHARGSVLDLAVPEESPIQIKRINKDVMTTGSDVRKELLSWDSPAVLHIRVPKDHPWKYCSVYRHAVFRLAAPADDTRRPAEFTRGNAFADYVAVPAPAPVAKEPKATRWPVVDASNLEPYINGYWATPDMKKRWSLAKQYAPMTLGLLAARAEACRLAFVHWNGDIDAACAVVDAQREAVDAKLRYTLCFTELMRGQEEEHAADNDARDVTERQLREQLARSCAETERVNKLYIAQMAHVTLQVNMDVDRIAELQATIKELRDNVAIAEREQMLKTSEIKTLTKERDDAFKELSIARQTINVLEKNLADTREDRNKENIPPIVKSVQNAAWNGAGDKPVWNSGCSMPGCFGHPAERIVSITREVTAPPAIVTPPTQDQQLASAAIFLRTLVELLDKQSAAPPPPQ